jgi:hypothetical protein
MSQKQNKIVMAVVQKAVSCFADAGACVHQQNIVAVVPDFQTGRVAAVPKVFPS